MPGVGIEPTCLAAHELKSCVYTSSTIPARQTISLYLHQNNIAKIVINQALPLNFHVYSPVEICHSRKERL